MGCEPNFLMTAGTVGAHMGPAPRCLPVEADLATVARFIRSTGQCYVPILEAGRPVGVIGERGLLIAEKVIGEHWEQVSVAAAMVAIPYCATPGTTVSEVARHLALRRLDVALVMVQSRIVGLFSTADALSLLADLASCDAGSNKRRSEAGSALSV